MCCLFFIMPPNKIWGIIKSDRPSVRSFVCPLVRLSVRLNFFMPLNQIWGIIKSDRPSVRLSENNFIFEKVCHLNCTYIWGHLSRTVSQFLLECVFEPLTLCFN